MDKKSKIYIAGHKGLVGSSIVRLLRSKNYTNLILIDKKQLNLLNQNDVLDFFEKEKPEYVFLAAAKVGGIIGNKKYPAEFIYENLQIQNNIIHSSHLKKVKKLLFLGSSCIYPKLSNQPIEEKELLSGYLEPTNEAYAIAKIAGLKMCQFYSRQYGDKFISCMPTNLYGINDNFDEENGHVIPSLINKFSKAIKNKTNVTCYGSGSALREFLYVDDMAEACLKIMENYEDTENTINIGTGEDISILNLVNIISKIFDFKGEIIWDKTKPDGTPRKILNIDKIKKMGWFPKISLKEGLLKTIQWFSDLPNF